MSKLEPDSLAAVFAKVPMFSGLSRQTLARIVAKIETETYARGATIFSQGDVGNALFVIQQGAIDIVIRSAAGETKSIAVLGPGEAFGEMALFTGQKRTATACALTDSAILKLARENWDDLLRQNPSLAFHFCQVLSRRLAAADQDMVRDRNIFEAGMQAFFEAQSAADQEFLLTTSVLRVLDVEAIEDVLQLGNARKNLDWLAARFPALLLSSQPPGPHYTAELKRYLTQRLADRMAPADQTALHQSLAAHFRRRQDWGSAVFHLLRSGSPEEAIEILMQHGEKLLESEPPEEILRQLDALPGGSARANPGLIRLKARACSRSGDLDTAIDRYREFLSSVSNNTEPSALAPYYEELADLYQQKGEPDEALRYLQLGLATLDADRADDPAIHAIESIGGLAKWQHAKGSTLRWTRRALELARRTDRRTATGLFARHGKAAAVVLACIAGWLVWWSHPSGLDETSTLFLALMAGAVALWITGAFDQHVVAVALLLAWVVSGSVPVDLALSGFSKSSWFFVLGVLGIGAAVTKSGLLYRVSLEILRRLPPRYRVCSFVLAASGAFITPLLPDARARMAIMAPVSHEISEALGFRPRSKGSAGLTLATYVGFSQLSFMYLTGTAPNLIGWNLLPDAARSDFGWGSWLFAAFPLGLFTLLFLWAATQLLFPVRRGEQPPTSPAVMSTQLQILGPLTRDEWICAITLGCAIVAWVAKPALRLSEAWVALGALLVFLSTGLVDKAGLKNGIDWGYLLFLGVVSALAGIMPFLGVDQWILGLIQPLLREFTYHPTAFLLAVAVLVYAIRLVLNNGSVVILFTLTLVPLAQSIGIHPGILLLTIMMSTDSWLLPHQLNNYLITYYSTGERAFSHAQARRLMGAKFAGSLIAVAIGSHYWQLLGYIR